MTTPAHPSSDGFATPPVSGLYQEGIGVSPLLPDEFLQPRCGRLHRLAAFLPVRRTYFTVFLRVIRVPFSWFGVNLVRGDCQEANHESHELTRILASFVKIGAIRDSIFIHQRYYKLVTSH